VPNVVLFDKAQRRSDRIRRDLPNALDMLTISVEAGLGFDAALAQVARNTEGPLADEFFRVLQEMQIGMGRTEAIRALGDRTSVPDLRSFTTAMVQADKFGIPIAEVLRIQAREMRLKRRQRAEEMAQKVPVKILFPLIFCIMPTLMVVILGPAIIQLLDFFG
jgi:tight adherence protein C